MIFILADELASDQEWGLEEVAALERLAHSAFDGAHVLAIESPAVSQRLLAVPAGTFSAVTVAVLKRLLSTFAFQGALLDLGLVKAMVTSVATVSIVRLRADRVLSLADVRTMSLEPTTLLAENLVDAKIYEIAAAHHLVMIGARGIRVAAIPRGGGGSTIVPELREMLEQQRHVCLAITDSDDRWPGCERSYASKSCDKLTADAKRPVGHFRLAVRELENLIPLQVLAELVEGDRAQSVDRLRMLITAIPEVRSCCDVKDGVMGERVFRLPEGSDERKFLSAVLSRNLGQENHCTRGEDCANERNNKECACVVVPKVGGVGSRFHDWLGKRTAHKALESFAGPWRESWLGIGAVTFSWCCAFAPMRG